MALRNSLLCMMMEKFPEHAERIENLFKANNDFRALCSDYVLCLAQLEKFKKEFSEKKLSLKEYAELHTALENELSEFLLNY